MSRKHGTNAKYVFDKCRCEACRQANRNAARDRYRQICYGRWEPYVDAQPVREHVRNLMDFGIGWMRIAEQAGVARNTVEKLIYGDRRRNRGPSKRVRPETAQKLLAVTAHPDRLGATTGVDPTGTRRRVHALAAMGWPLAHLGLRLGINRSNLGRTLRAPRVRITTDRAIRALYNQLWNLNPLEHGVSLHSYNTTRRWARDNGWAPVGAWDDDTIDNPDAHADWTGKCGTPEGYTAHYTYQLLPTCQPCRDARATLRAEKRAAA